MNQKNLEEGEIKNYKYRRDKNISKDNCRSRSRNRKRNRSKSYEKLRFEKSRDNKNDKERRRKKSREIDRSGEEKKLRNREEKSNLPSNVDELKNESNLTDENNKIIREINLPIDDGVKEQTLDYNKIREERKKRLEELKKKFDKSEQKEFAAENKKAFNIVLMTNDDRIKLVKLVEEEREKNFQLELKLLQTQSPKTPTSKLLEASALNGCGDKSPDMFSETPLDNLISEDQKVLTHPTSEEDSSGYYMPKLNELLNNKYKVIGICGRGIFSNVVKVVDINNSREYAVKILRAIDIMIISGEKEKGILKRLNEIDKHDRSNVVRLIDHFELKRHLCLVFELYEMNLRDLLKSRGVGVGISLQMVRSYAQQLLFAFDLVHKYKIIHADFKPDNTIVNKSLDQVRLCDFGSALQVDEAVITSELVSRFYRAPEIILGCPYDTKIDIWSLGCTLFELYTGKILFPGRNNNEMIKLIMMAKGKIPHKVIKRGQSNLYFNESGDFLSMEVDPFSKKEFIKEINVNHYPVKDLLSLLKSSRTEKILTSEENSMIVFRDFLEKCLHLDPHKRLNTLEALTHEFIGIMPISK